MKRNMFCINFYSHEWRPNERQWKWKNEIAHILFIMILKSWLVEHGYLKRGRNLRLGAVN